MPPDTRASSALIPLFIRESTSDALLDWVDSSGDHLAISDWSLVEFASAAAIKVRMGVMSSKLPSCSG